MGGKVTRRKSTRLAILLVIAILAAGLSAMLVCSSWEGFSGSRIKNPDAYILDIRRMNGTDSHTLELEAGDVLQVRFETEKGSLHMEITAPDGTRIYAGNGREATDFAVNVPDSGAYTVSVEARRGAGRIHVLVKGNGA